MEEAKPPQKLLFAAAAAPPPLPRQEKGFFDGCKLSKPPANW
jgi:hypothetical protein